MRPDDVERDDPPPLPALMVGEVLDNQDGHLTVLVPTIDRGVFGIDAFGYWPDAQPKDPVRVHLDERNRAVVVAWEPA